MKTKNFFDDIYDNKLIFDKKALYKTKEKSFNKTIEKEIKEQIEFRDSDLELLLDKARKNPTALFTKDEAEMVLNKLEETKKEAKKTLNEIKEMKEFHYDKASKAQDKFELDISDNSLLKRSANRVFGGNKKQITYEDYATLIEMKKELEAPEALELLTGVEPDGIL